MENELKLLDTILIATNDKTFSLTESIDIVGGESRLMSLIGKGLIRAEKSANRQNARWNINASDVLRNAKVYYKRHRNRKKYEKGNNQLNSA